MASVNINPQSQSRFMTALPREIRDLIYLAIWQLPNHGLRQHIIWHRNKLGEGRIHEEERRVWGGLSPSQQARLESKLRPHFCRWPCSRDSFDVADPLQEEIEKEWVRLGPVVGGTRLQDAVLDHHLRSPWFDHWPCGEEAVRSRGTNAISGVTTSGGDCWRAGGLITGLTSEKTSWLPMLLVCKAMSAEVLKSIYESTTFIFTDTLALQLVLGFCQISPLIQTWTASHLRTPPPGLFKYAANLEISLSAGFSSEFWCSDRSDPELDLDSPNAYPAPEGPDTDPPPLHNAYDFHWLRLDQFENLRSLKIWVAARGYRVPDESEFVATPDLSADAVKGLVEGLGGNKVSSVVVSMPLAGDIGHLEDGYVEGVSPRSNVRLWKRGTGDRFHPYPFPISNRWRGMISVRSRREVLISRIYDDDLIVSPKSGASRTSGTI